MRVRDLGDEGMDHTVTSPFGQQISYLRVRGPRVARRNERKWVSFVP